MHIILPVDGSTESIAAVREIARLPWRESPQVTVVTALVDSPYDLVPSNTGLQLAEAERLAAVENFQLSKRMLAGTYSTIQHVIQRRHPRRLIMETAEQNDADLVALGTRGHSAAYRLLLGSTADYVANHAKCSVLAVRANDSQEPAPGDAFRILLAYDGSDASREAVRQMCQFDWPKEDTAIHLSMILERPKSIPQGVPYDLAETAAADATLTELKDTHQIVDNFTQSVRESLHVGNSIRAIAEKEDSALIFVGGTGKSLVAKFFLGSTSRYILHHAHCSVWVGREKAWHREAPPTSEDKHEETL